MCAPAASVAGAQAVGAGAKLVGAQVRLVSALLLLAHVVYVVQAAAAAVGALAAGFPAGAPRVAVIAQLLQPRHALRARAAAHHPPRHVVAPAIPTRHCSNRTCTR